MSRVTQIRQRARNYLQKGKYEKAIEEYKRLTGMETKNPNYLNELGDIYLKAGDSIQAVSNFDKAVVNYEKVALYNNAVAVCKKILRIIPDRGETIYKLGELRAKQKLSGEANVYFSQYLDHLLANADSIGSELNEKIDGILELVSENADILCKASDVMVLIGNKTGALEIYGKLHAEAEKAGDGERAASVRSKIDILKQSMTKDEIDIVENACSAAAEEGAAGEAETEREMPEAATADVEQPATEAEAGQPVQETDAAEDIPPEDSSVEIDAETPADDTSNRVAGEDGAEGAPPAGAGEMEAEEEAHELEGGSPKEPEEEKVYAVDEAAPYDEAASAGTAAAGVQEEGEMESQAPDESGEMAPGDMGDEILGRLDEAVDEDREEESGGEDTAAVEPGREDEPEAEQGDGEKREGVQDDLSGLLDDSRNADTAENLAEEITSDVEEDDFRSHYDVGMAYLEMALYTEAIKEFQIASRSEQIQIKSIEMIGHCFLMQNNPRLAVKQLLRGLELVKVTNADNLGVHYNLGLAYEMLGDLEKAREQYEEVYIVDISFRDIAEKMKKLSTVS